MSKDYEQVEVRSRAELRAWLASHHTQQESIWLVTYKKMAGSNYLPYDEIVEEALCFGWVDSQPRSLDQLRSMRLLSPRQPGSAWSRVNKERVERLIEHGLMAPAGLEKVEAAKRDGSWSRLDAVENLEIPADLAEALGRYPNAARHFHAFPRSVKRSILEWIVNAKKAETRARRVEETARLAEENLRANQWRYSHH